MEIQYFKEYSPALGREMECTVYGHAGRPVLFIPCQDGHHNDFEGFHMTDTWSPWIEAGKVMVFSIDTIDAETWSNKGATPTGVPAGTSSGSTISPARWCPSSGTWSTSAMVGTATPAS